MMGRAERRRTQKLEQKAKTATYNLTKEQLNIAVREQVGKELERIKQEATDDAVNTAMVLLLTLPLEVLMDHYWTKTYAKRIPRFTELVLEYYERWQNGELDAEGYSDPTAYEALKNMEQEEERFHKLLDTIFALCELSDFHIEERIVIKDKRTGRIWR